LKSPLRATHVFRLLGSCADLQMTVCISGDLKAFWTQLESRRVDLIFEQVQEVLLLLKEKIKNGTATNQGLKSL